MKKHKRIYIFVGDYYPSSQSATAQLISELAEQISASGHEIYIIVPSPQVKFPYEIKIVNDQKVVFFKSPDTKVSNRILRTFNELILSVTCYFSLRGFIRDNPPEYLITYSPTIFYGPYVSYLRKKLKVKNYLILRDIFPQWAVECGLIRENSFVHKFFRFFEELNYKAATNIGLEAPSIVEQFNKRHVNHATKTELLINWVANKATKTEKRNSIREKYDLYEKIIFFYGGNIGVGQDVENIVRLAENMKQINNVIFVILGTGTEREKIFKMIQRKNLNENIIFAEGVEQKIYMDYLTEIDIGLISLNKNTRGHNIPGKILNYARMGIPILGSVNQGNDIIRIINENNAGIVVENGDDKSFAKAASSFLEASFRSKKSIGSNSLVEKIFSVDVALKKILEKID